MFASKGLVRSRCMDIELVCGGGPIAKKTEKKTTTAIGFAPFQRKAIYHQNMSNYIVWLPLKKQILKIRSMLLETIAYTTMAGEFKDISCGISFRTSILSTDVSWLVETSSTLIWRLHHQNISNTIRIVSYFSKKIFPFTSIDGWLGVLG